MAAKYYTHFVTATAEAQLPSAASEWSGVVELLHPLEQSPDNGSLELQTLLARSFDLDSESIRILDWARLH